MRKYAVAHLGTHESGTQDEWRLIDATEFPPSFGWSRECRLHRESVVDAVDGSSTGA